MKTLFAMACLLMAPAYLNAQQPETKSLTITSSVYGNRYCAKLSATGAIMSYTMGGGNEEIPGPADSCVPACTPEGERFLVTIQNDRSFTYRAKDAAPLKDFCGKKVIVTGKPSPAEKENDFIFDIETVMPYIAPEKKPLIESQQQSAKFASVAKTWYEALAEYHSGKGKMITVADTAQAESKQLIENTADQAMWELLRSFSYNLRRLVLVKGLSYTEDEKAKAAAQDAEWKPILKKCSDFAYRNILLSARPSVTNCQAVPENK